MGAGPTFTTRRSIQNSAAAALAGSWWERLLAALRKIGIHKAALVAFSQNQAGNTFWEKMGFTVRTDLTYRNRALTELRRIDT